MLSSRIRLPVMPRETEPSNIERAFILEAIQENVRLDGRSLLQLRDINLTFGVQHGNATVELGKTKCEVLGDDEFTRR